MVVASPVIISDVAIVDPAMTKSMPPGITAFTGMDALTHAIESYISNKATTLTETLAITAIELIGSNLRQAVANGENMNARSNMAQASMFAGMAFGNSSVGTVHAVAHALGGFFNIAHGVANALMLPYVMRYNLIACPSKFEDIAIALGENVEGLSEMEAALLSVEAVEMLAEDIGIPTNLKDIGADPSRLEDLVAESEKQGAYPLSPRVPTREATRKMFQDAFNGPSAPGS
jgi:alcohol dehydrogenase class IV